MVHHCRDGEPLKILDMILKPDLNKTFEDPFAKSPTHIVICDVYDPMTKGLYSRDPRASKRAERYLIQTKIADRAYFGPEPEFLSLMKSILMFLPFSSYIRLLSRESTSVSHPQFYSNSF